MATPVIDQIHYETFQHNVYSGATAAVGSFTWMLNFDWIYTSNEEYKRRGSNTAPTRSVHIYMAVVLLFQQNVYICRGSVYSSATMAGGLFTINALFFQEIGFYDPGLELYGAENLELSFKVHVIHKLLMNVFL